MESTNHLQKEYGNKRPFSVPEDYFSGLSSRVMAQIPAEEQEEKSVAANPRRTLVRYLRPLSAAAATVGVVAVGFLAYHEFGDKQAKSPMAESRTVQRSQEVSAASEDDFDQAADYFMIDESDMYAYLESE